MNADIHSLITRWEHASTALRIAIALELDARAALTAVAFTNPTEGVNNQPLGDGRILQGTFKRYYNLDNKRVEDALKLLPKSVAAGLVSWDAKLKVGAYKALEPAHRAVVNEVLTITPGRPALEVVLPKER
jgi:hypothetical protein